MSLWKGPLSKTHRDLARAPSGLPFLQPGQKRPGRGPNRCPLGRKRAQTRGRRLAHIRAQTSQSSVCLKVYIFGIARALLVGEGIPILANGMPLNSAGFYEDRKPGFSKNAVLNYKEQRMSTQSRLCAVRHNC